MWRKASIKQKLSINVKIIYLNKSINQDFLFEIFLIIFQTGLSGSFVLQVIKTIQIFNLVISWSIQLDTVSDEWKKNIKILFKF